ncbi:hypothetical protein M3Y95_00229000 [Aphelenchoides besseyi]|nr:hypothetical protein M3Y95_00229000 [Aphelenchoides besseyi]
MSSNAKNLKAEGRDRRIFTSIRSTLGANTSTAPRRNFKPKNSDVRPPYQTLDEALRELDKAIEQPSTSLLDFEVYLRKNGSKFGEEECQEAASKLLKYTMASGEFRFFIKITSDCIGHHELASAISRELLLIASDYFSSGDQTNQNVPELFGHIVASRWPPGKGKAMESVNPVLYVVHSLICSWVDNETDVDKEEETSEESTPLEEENDHNENVVDSPTGSGGQETNSEEETKDPTTDQNEVYDKQMVTMAALAICTICNIAQRNFWLNAMEAFDNVFMATKHLLTEPKADLSRNVKQSLLQLYVNLFKWSATGQPKCTSVSTQASD